MKIRISTLKNGIRTIMVPVEGLKSVTVEVFIKIGSKYELKDEFGMSHFLEHMAFKGTKKRPTAATINQEIDGKGAGYNAGTSHEMTSYHITTIRENIGWAVELLADMLKNSIYEEKEVLKERGVIMEEIRMYRDNPMMGLSGEMTKFLYGESEIGCWDIAGEISDIEKVNRLRVVNFRDKLINPKEMVVVVAGNVDDRADNEVKKYFEDFENKNYKGLPEVKVKMNESLVKNMTREVEQGHFAMALPALRRSDERRYAFKLVDVVLGGNTSSRLYQRIREDMGLAYYVFSISDSFEEVGFWGIQSGVKLDRLDEAILVVREELERLNNKGVGKKELDRAKDYIEGKTKLAMDRSNYWSSFMGTKMLLENEVGDLDEEIKKSRQVSLEEVNDLVKDIFKKDKIRVMTIRNKKK
ncbi:MAG TPA: pitrilysin family protein [Candidatus Woesebacteria bacterium]|nr:insulinase family protein [Candidatus Shapirobacteria bacterium]HOR02365.1 pitrilysin family protein [Candidatus Woesebacteria bacterium]